jgi:hypothetical protein
MGEQPCRAAQRECLVLAEPKLDGAMRSILRIAIAIAMVFSFLPRVAIAGCTSAVISIPALGDGSDMSGISGLSTSDVWAVGTGAPKNAPSDALTEHFDRTQWSVVPVQLSAGINSLTSVSEYSPNDVWAVGSSKLSSGATASLAVRWNGSAWMSVTVPDMPVYFNTLMAVAVNRTNPNDAWAVGFSADNGNGAFFFTILHWNGAAWTMTSYESYVAELWGVAITPTGQAWAVGGNGSPLAFHWDGQAWTKHILPGNGGLLSVTAISDDDVWAVGSKPMQRGALIEHYDGQTWAVVHSPGYFSQAVLSSVSGTSSNDVWASGYREQAGNSRTLIEHWDGTSWTIVPTSNPRSYDTIDSIQALPGGALSIGTSHWGHGPGYPLSESAQCSPSSR